METLGDKEVANFELHKYQCEQCDDKCSKKYNEKNSLKHPIATLGDIKVAQNELIKYYCNICDYKCSKKYNWNKHLTTSKHKIATLGDIKVAKSGNQEQHDNVLSKFSCNICNKEYTSRNGLWKHNKTHHDQPNDDISDKALIMMLIKENTEFKNMMMKMVDNGINNCIANKSINNCTNNTINNNTIDSHNKAFNLNFYLNETCKDAMNISDFVNSIKINLEDLENIGRTSYIEGVSNIILKNLNNIEKHLRPLHCSDSKREILYIKENNEWTKETDSKPILTKAIKIIANENIKQIKHWAEKHPDCTKSSSRKNDLYLKIVSNSMNGLTEEEGRKNINKIISNLAKETVIQKN